MTARGFSLIELLVAAALALAVSGALAAMVTPLGTIVRRAHASADVDAGARAALHQVAADLRQAGSDASIAAPHIRLARVLPALVPLDDLATGASAVPATAVRIAFVPHLAAQSVLAEPAAPGDAWIRLQTTARCTTGPPSCGFRDGDAAVLYTNTEARTVTIAATAGDVLALTAPVGSAFPAGAVLATLVTVTYGTRPAADGSRRLVRLTMGGAEQPMLDDVVHFEVVPDAEDSRDATRVALRLRVQAAAPAFRGPEGYLFARGGSAAHMRHWIADVELRMVVALRNRVAAS